MPFEFLDRLADLVPPPRKHRHRYHGVFAPNHQLRKAVTALAIGNLGTQREVTTGGHGNDGHGSRGCCTSAKPSLDFALLATSGCCGHPVREPGPIRIILTHLGEPLEPPPVSPARGPPTDWAELVQIHDDRDVLQASPDELPTIDIHSL